jgi:thymidylate kinase
MKIIVLQGMPNTGKTTTINFVWDVLCANGAISTNRQPYGGDPNDFIDTVLWNNLRIGILSMGDMSTYIAKEIKNFNNQECDVVICALSINDRKVIANNTINSFTNTRIDKTIANVQLSEQQANTTDAQTICNLI